MSYFDRMGGIGSTLVETWLAPMSLEPRLSMRVDMRKISLRSMKLISAKTAARLYDIHQYKTATPRGVKVDVCVWSHDGEHGRYARSG